MKLLVFVTCLAVLSVVHCWTSIEPHDKSTDHLGHCYSTSDPDTVGAMKSGEVKTKANACVRVTCGEDRDIEYAGCGKQHVLAPCTLSGEDLSKPYPQCCPKPICPRA